MSGASEAFGRSVPPTFTFRLELFDRRAARDAFAEVCARRGHWYTPDGVATNGHDGPGTAADRCVPCAAAFRKRWTRERIVEAIRLFASRYGRPPGARDFDPTNARNRGHPDRAARWERDGDYPHATVVQEEFGTWNRGIEAAGFAATRAAAASGPGSISAAEYVETVRLYERHGSAEAARRLGLTPSGVRYRVRYARERGLA